MPLPFVAIFKNSENIGSDMLNPEDIVPSVDLFCTADSKEDSTDLTGSIVETGIVDTKEDSTDLTGSIVETGVVDSKEDSTALVGE